MKKIAICLTLFVVILMSGCGVKNDNQKTSVSETHQISEEEKAKNEEDQLKLLAGDGELIKITDQDKKDIAEWVAKYKESKDTAFEKVDGDWNYKDPAGVWFAQKELGFDVVNNPPINLEEFEKQKKEANKNAVSGCALNYYEDMVKTEVGFNVFGETKYNHDKYCSDNHCFCGKYPDVSNVTKEELENLFSDGISALSTFINIVNQYYSERVPRSELVNKDNVFSCLRCSKMNVTAIDLLEKVAPLIGGAWTNQKMFNRIEDIISNGGPNMIYEIMPLTEMGENNSYFSEIKSINDSDAILIAGQLKLKITTFEKINDDYIRKTVRYVDFLNTDNGATFPSKTGTNRGAPELLYYGSSGFGITNKIQN